jgi:multidrug efflux system outer membrane protein
VKNLQISKLKTIRKKTEAQNINVIDKSWNLFIQDSNLISLIEIALKSHQELNVLEQEINISNNVVMARQGKYLPKIGLNGVMKTENQAFFQKKAILKTYLT